jgi:hypothetical protein
VPNIQQRYENVAYPLDLSLHVPEKKTHYQKLKQKYRLDWQQKKLELGMAQAECCRVVMQSLQRCTVLVCLLGHGKKTNVSFSKVTVADLGPFVSLDSGVTEIEVIFPLNLLGLFKSIGPHIPEREEIADFLFRSL